MMPVPFFQVVEFLDWINRNPNLEISRLSQESLLEQAYIYLQGNSERLPEESTLGISGRISEINANRLLRRLLTIFQVCPIINESSIHDQMEHFSTCGKCITYIQRENISTHFVPLHPFLEQFVQSEQGRWLASRMQKEITLIFRELSFREETNEDRIFKFIISNFGKDIQLTFFEYLEGKKDSDLAQRYVSDRRKNKRFQQRDERGHPTTEKEFRISDDGTIPLGMHEESIETAAMRLAESVRFLIKGDFYEEQVRRSPEVFNLLRAAGIISSNAAQAVEFIWWLQESHPTLDILASIPTKQIQDLTIKFCEEKNYNNSVSFSKEVVQWSIGKGENSILDRLIHIGKRIKTRNKTYRNSVSPFKRYQTVPFHAIYLFLSVGDFPEYINKYWEDLNHLTGDHLDVYYSFEDIERKVSAYEVLREFRSLSIGATSLPAMLLWKKNLAESCVISLQQLSHTDIFDVTKLIVQEISSGEQITDICKTASTFVQDRTDSLLPGPKVIIRQGEVTMGDKYTIGQAGAVGPNSHAHDMTFNQMWNQNRDDLDLEKLSIELSTLRKELKEVATEPEHDSAIGEIAFAEVAAKKGDGPSVLQHLSKAGKWTFDVATKIGVTVAAAALKSALGL